MRIRIGGGDSPQPNAPPIPMKPTRYVSSASHSPCECVRLVPPVLRVAPRWHSELRPQEARKSAVRKGESKDKKLIDMRIKIAG
jgi:hypothetical protein